MVTSPEALAPLLAPPAALVATFAPSYPSERLLRLPGGSWAPSCSEAYRLACEMRSVSLMADPDAELRLRADWRSGKDAAAAARILLALRQAMAAWRADDAADTAMDAAASAVLALPDREARRAAVEAIRAGAGALAAESLAERVRALWAVR